MMAIFNDPCFAEMLLAGLSPDAAGCVIAVWLFAAGGAIGSFLNVVIYRLPAGMSLVKPASHCRGCNRPIRWHDNVPVLGWLVLRGRCRDCGAKISARYPTVEAVTAALFLLLGIVEILSGGVNLPLGPDETLAPAFSGLCGIYAFHLLLLCTLLAAVLIEVDGHRLPIRLFVPAAIVGVAAPIVWPHLHPVPVWPTLQPGLARLIGSPTGLAAGVLLGWLASRPFGPKWRTGMVLASACAGAVLGWQATVVLPIVTLAIHLPLAALGRLLPGLRRVPPTIWLALATLGWILAWVRLAAWWPVPA